MNPDTGRQQRVEAGSDEELEWPSAAEYRREKKETKKKVDKALDTAGKAVTDTLSSEAGQRGIQQVRAGIAAGGRRVAVAGSKLRGVASGTVGSAVAAIGSAGVAAAVLAAGAAGYLIGSQINKALEKRRDLRTPEAVEAEKTRITMAARRRWEQEQGRAMTQPERAEFNRRAGLGRVIRR